MSRTEAIAEARLRWVVGKPSWPHLEPLARRREGVYEVGYSTMWGGRPHANIVCGKGPSWEAAFADADATKGGRRA